MSRRYKVICAALAIAVLPGAVPIAAGVLLARAIRRVRARRQIKRIVIAAGNWRPEYRGEA